MLGATGVGEGGNGGEFDGSSTSGGGGGGDVSFGAVGDGTVGGGDGIT